MTYHYTAIRLAKIQRLTISSVVKYQQGTSGIWNYKHNVINIELSYENLTKLIQMFFLNHLRVFLSRLRHKISQLNIDFSLPLGVQSWERDEGIWSQVDGWPPAESSLHSSICWGVCSDHLLCNHLVWSASSLAFSSHNQENALEAKGFLGNLATF